MNLIRTICLLVTASMICLEIAMAHADTFAPLIELPEDISGSEISFLEAQTVKKSVVPRKEEVGVPAYPGAKILFTQSGNRATINGINTQLPNRVFLGTAASPDKVVDYYADALKKWSMIRGGGATVFYPNSDSENPIEDQTIPKIIVTPADPPRKLMPEALTNIDIYYYSDQSPERLE